MLDDVYADILRQYGFGLVGQLSHQIQLSAWWNGSPNFLMQILAVELGPSVLLKADKSYYLQSITREGETWARDIPALHDYLETHFPEARIAFSHFRDVPTGLANVEVSRLMAARAPTSGTPSFERVRDTRTRLRELQQQFESAKTLATLAGLEPDILTGYAAHQRRQASAQLDAVQHQLEREEEQLRVLKHLQREYARKGSAASYSFTINSNTLLANNAQQFHDALQSVTKELRDQNRYQIKQKLQGGRMNIQVAEAEEPEISWIELWFGGALSPTQLQKVTPGAGDLRALAEQRTMVMPDEPIVVDGHVRQSEKHFSARFVSAVLQRLDKTEARLHPGQLDPERIPAEAIPLSIGQRIDDGGRAIGPAVLPLAQMIHAYVSGTTGSGKSFLARALVEEASRFDGLGILVIDPRNQFAGLLVPEDRPGILEHYERFGMRPHESRGFAFKYMAPAFGDLCALPHKLSSLSAGRSIVSFKGLDDERRCSVTSEILDNVFSTLSQSESDRPRLLIVVDEAQLLTRRRVEAAAKQAASQSERALDRVAREGRKYGIVMVLISQTIKDYAYELASLRQMTTTKVFLRNSDLEIDYATDVIGDGRLLVQLATGTAIIHNADWGTHRIRIRPPYSKVCELDETSIRALLSKGHLFRKDLSTEARSMLSIIRDRGRDGPLNMSLLASLAGVTSKRRLQTTVDELVGVGAIRTIRLSGPGRPRVAELVVSHANDA